MSKEKLCIVYRDNNNLEEMVFYKDELVGFVVSDSDIALNIKFMFKHGRNHDIFVCWCSLCDTDRGNEFFANIIDEYIENGAFCSYNNENKKLLLTYENLKGKITPYY